MSVLFTYWPIVSVIKQNAMIENLLCKVVLCKAVPSNNELEVALTSAPLFRSFSTMATSDSVKKKIK